MFGVDPGEQSDDRAGRRPQPIRRRRGNADWKPFVDSFIAGWFKLDPAFAVYEGKHEYDGRLPDWSDAGLQRQVDYLRQAITKAGAFDTASLSPQQRFEQAYLIQVAKGKLFWLVDADQPPYPIRPSMSAAGSIPTSISRGPMPTTRRG